jgi:hypothetical protein
LKIDCLHGYYKFYEEAAGEISRFMALYGFSLVKSGDHFTFETLFEAPEYSLEGGSYLGATADVTHEGHPHEVMKANELIYDFNSDSIKDINTITQKIAVSQGQRYYLSDGLIIAGSLTDEGLRVMDYAAFFDFGTLKFKYSEITWLES